MTKLKKNLATTKYKGRYYGRNEDSVWIVLPEGVRDLDDPRGFIVSLDDSKSCGYRRMVDEANNEKSAKKYIDWVKRIE